jgi:two-component sensor histidine kinase
MYNGIGDGGHRCVPAMLASRTYGLWVFQHNCTRGDEQEVSLAERVEPVHHGCLRILDGVPSLVLAAKAAQNFALALHELATNAAKYGALSNSTGRVHINWSKLRSNGSSLFTFRCRSRADPKSRRRRRKDSEALCLNT